MATLYNNILETVGNTPVVKFNNIGPNHVDIYAKLEAFNPLGSVKDRLALSIVERAEKDGSLKPGQTVVEGTSGNTGIGLAMVCAQKGYPLVIVMAENFSVERRRLMRYLGAKVVLTPASEKGMGMMRKAKELAEEHGWFLCRQFETEANPDVHSDTTAREILEAFSSRGLDYWVTGMGTGGTLKGVARVLKQESPHTVVVASEPDNSPILGSGIVQDYLNDGSPASSHPSFRPHLMRGWTPDFIPKLAMEALRQKLVDRIIPVGGVESLELARDLARKEGVFCGISAGATLAAALVVAETASEGSSILVMIPDTGERYLSTVLFDEIETDMDEEEMVLSVSTPNYRFDVSKAPATSVNLVQPAKQEAIFFVNDRANDKSEPVTMFGLEWCEFCWSVRKFFEHMQIPYRAIDLDSVEYQKEDFGGDIRAALRELTGASTIPQIYVGGEHIGGCTEAFDAFNNGILQEMLKANGVDFVSDKNPNAYEFLPTWLQPR